jgi:hypothetical protein
MPVSVVWLYGILVLAGRRSEYIIILVLSRLMTGIPIIHMRGVGVGFGTTRSGGLFFIWTLLALGVSALFSVRGLWGYEGVSRGSQDSREFGAHRSIAAISSADSHCPICPRAVTLAGCERKR